MSYYIYDIDGTLANIEHRIHFVRRAKGERKDWKSFFHPSNMDQDEPIKAVIHLLQLNKSFGMPAIYCTGRPNHLREPTLDWLQTHVEPKLPFSPTWRNEDAVRTREALSKRLFMRPSDDHSDDSVAKPALVQNIIDRYGPPLAMFEDRDRVVKAVRAMGVKVFQVADGNF